MQKVEGPAGITAGGWTPTATCLPLVRGRIRISFSLVRLL